MKKAKWSFFVCIGIGLICGGTTIYFLFSEFILPGKDATIESLQLSSQGSRSNAIVVQSTNDGSTVDGGPHALVVEDIVRQAFPTMQLDFRLSNPSSNSIAISRVYLLLWRIETWSGMQLVGSQRISDTATMFLTQELREGDVLQAPLAVVLKPQEKDRFVVSFKWDGPLPDRAYYYTAVPALKTSAGYVQCPLVRLYIQPQGKTDRKTEPQMPSWDIPSDQKSPLIDWRKQSDLAKPLR